MWYELESLFATDGIVIGTPTQRALRVTSLLRAGGLSDRTTSFFVGDAAGRGGDFASTDRKWALNVDVPFFTPEVRVANDLACDVF